jgi:hypothetical protein
MNHLSKRAVAPLKRRRQSNKADPQAGHRTAGGLTAGRYALIGVCLFIVAGGTWSVLEFFVWNKVPPELVGIWEVTEGPAAGATFEFSRTGAFETRAKDKGSYFTLKGRATVEDKTLFTTTRHSMSGREETRKSTIRELTESTLILELENGEVLKLLREQ